MFSINNKPLLSTWMGILLKASIIKQYVRDPKKALHPRDPLGFHPGAAAASGPLPHQPPTFVNTSPSPSARGNRPWRASCALAARAGAGHDGRPLLDAG